jgi:hypothetical protein
MPDEELFSLAPAMLEDRDLEVQELFGILAKIPDKQTQVASEAR